MEYLEDLGLVSKNLYNNLEVIHLFATKKIGEQAKKRNKKENQDYNQKEILQYECPVYTTSLRGPSYVFKVNLPVKKQEDVRKWILAGVALFMNED